MDEITRNWLFTISGVVAGGVIGILTSWFSNWYVMKKKAASELRDAFCKILSGIRTHKLPLESDIRNFALGSFEAHTIEMERFRFYVSDIDKEEYDKACEEYRRMVYMRPINHGFKTPVDKFYIEKVEAILKFARPL